MFGCCCQSCRDGGTISRWLNQTKVRPLDDDSPASYTAAPFMRYDNGDVAMCMPPAHAGECGHWLFNGDLNGVSAQVIEATVNDIMACAGADATHATKDHNCYLKSGTVDTTTARRGGRWLLGRKYWHGLFGFTHGDAGCPDPYESTSQTKYLTVTYSDLKFSRIFLSGRGINGYWSEVDYVLNGTTSVARFTGITSQDVDATGFFRDANGYVPPSEYLHENIVTGKGAGTEYVNTGGTPFTLNRNSGMATLLDGLVGQGFDCGKLPVIPDANFGNTGGPNYTPNCTLAGFVDWWNTQYGASALFTALPVVSDVNNYSSTATASDVGIDVSATLSWSKSEQSFTWNFVYILDQTSNPGPKVKWVFSGTINLEEPYTAGDCKQDFDALWQEWPLSNHNLYPWRTDEKLALAPLCIYDEIGPSTPLMSYTPTMNDYAAGLVDDSNGVAPGDPGYITTWAQKDWISPNNYVWQSPDGSYFGEAEVGGYAPADIVGSTFITPLRDGAKITHNTEGSDRHFWFNYAKQRRFQGPSPFFYWLWETEGWGGLSDADLPKATLRWMDNDEAQYDPAAFRNALPDDYFANYPQSFYKERNGILTGAKYVEATQTWPSVNCARPCGADKYSVDQSTVATVQSIAGSVYTVKWTGNASASLVVGDYVLVEDEGIYPVTDVDDLTGGYFDITLGSLIDTLPTGITCLPYEFSGLGLRDDGQQHVGKLRFINYTQGGITRASAPGICGRVAITCTESGGTVTITSATALPFLRDDINGDILVDLYDAVMGSKVQANLTRVDDQHWTFAHAAIPSHVWMTGRDVNYTWNDSTPQHHCVNLEWRFDNRAAAKDPGDQPAWFGGITGLISAEVRSFVYHPSGACPVVVGIVPYYSAIPNPLAIPNPNANPPAFAPVESFDNQAFYPMADMVPLDSSYGALWLGATEQVMVDPFWQAPYKPDGDGATINWHEDDGSGQMDADPDYYYPHHALVEATGVLKSGQSIPDSLELFYALDAVISPPYYVVGAGGLPIGGTDGSYGSFERPWGFAARACTVDNRFKDYYRTFTVC